MANLGQNTAIIAGSKLVRSKMHKHIKPEFLSSVEVGSTEHVAYLNMKLLEEIRELTDSDFRDVNEFADVYEVLDTLQSIRKISHDEIERARFSKIARRGDFFYPLIWHYADDPEFDPEKHSHITS